MLRPSPPDSVQSSTGTRSRKAAMAASLSGPLRPPSKRAKAKPCPCQQVGEVVERLAVVDEDQFLLVRIAPQQVDQRRLLAAVAGWPPSAAPAACQLGIAPWRAAKRADGGGCRGRRRSGGAEQMVQREPVLPLLRPPAGAPRGELLVGRPLALSAVHADASRRAGAAASAPRPRACCGPWRRASGRAGARDWPAGAACRASYRRREIPSAS